jgi:hypothetical protein
MFNPISKRDPRLGERLNFIPVRKAGCSSKVIRRGPKRKEAKLGELVAFHGVISLLHRGPNRLPPPR